MRRLRRILLTSNIILLTSYLAPLQAQPVLDVIRQNPAFAACNYNTYPDSLYTLTPAPRGKKPFYISHYGRHGSRYISSRKGYDIPFRMMLQAERVDELTPIGKKVLAEMRLVMNDTEDRWGELSNFGRTQHEWIARHMMQQFPEVFSGNARVNARSTIVPRCMVSMGAAVMQLAQMNPNLQITMEASKRDMWYMNHQDTLLRKHYMTPAAKKAYNEYTAKRVGNSRLMEMIFKNPDIVKEIVDETQFNYYLIKMGLFQLNTHPNMKIFIRELFQPEELYQLWQIDNALWYIQHGAYKLNGGRQPYSQRYLLRQLIADADSCIALEKPGAQLRFGHETVLLPLVCLLGINGYDFATDDLNQLEEHGWWCSDVFPMASNVQFIFYRRNPQDKDVLFKVLLNEKEATLPLRTDCAPYYHWSDFRRHYLKKVERY